MRQPRKEVIRNVDFVRQNPMLVIDVDKLEFVELFANGVVGGEAAILPSLRFTASSGKGSAFAGAPQYYLDFAYLYVVRGKVAKTAIPAVFDG